MFQTLGSALPTKSTEHGWGHADGQAWMFTPVIGTGKPGR